MKRTLKIFLTITIISLVVIIGIKFFSNWTNDIMEDKPKGPYHSTKSIKEAKEESVWIATYLPEAHEYFSFNKLDSFSISEIWVEDNENQKEVNSAQSNYNSILNINFENLTKESLHKFRLVPYSNSYLNEYKQVQYPDGYPRIRFLINKIQDTIRIEIIERNPSDSLNWMSEKIIDTLTLMKMK
jgi:hypothetical protein